MGFLNDAFKKLQDVSLEEIKKSTSGKKGKNNTTTNNDDDDDDEEPAAPDNVLVFSGRSSISDLSSLTTGLTMAEVFHYGCNANRWEKAVVATDSLVNAVNGFDPDGVDIVCVGGIKKGLEGAFAFDMDDEAIETFNNIVDTTAIEEKITARDPGGPCPLGTALEAVLHKALHEDSAEKQKRQCSVLVLTAGKPDDPELLEEALRKASQTVADRGGVEACPLSVSFVQIGKDEEAEAYLRYLDKKMVGYSGDTDEKVDIVDTMGFQELKKTVDFIGEEREKQQGKQALGAVAGTALGAIAGAAIGLGSLYLASHQNGKKRAGSGTWAGKWKCFYGNDEIATLTVKDDSRGNLTIKGLRDTLHGTYGGGDAGSEGFFIRFRSPSGDPVEGTLVDDAETPALTWSDGTRWEAVNQPHWAGALGVAAAGAAAAGFAGYAIQKRFFAKVETKEACDYVLVLDRSRKMQLTDGSV